MQLKVAAVLKTPKRSASRCRPPAAQPGFFVGTITSRALDRYSAGQQQDLAAKLTTLKTVAVDLKDATETIERTVEIDTPDNPRRSV
ncbi:MAG: hypothetical protein U0514_01255 [Candidatus Andersenbacteria bacterium]